MTEEITKEFGADLKDDFFTDLKDDLTQVQTPWIGGSDRSVHVRSAARQDLGATEPTEI